MLKQDERLGPIRQCDAVIAMHGQQALAGPVDVRNERENGDGHTQATKTDATRNGRGMLW